MRVRLWFVRETEKARLYCRIPMSWHPGPEDEIWVPRSVVNHTTKRPAKDGERPEHEIEMEDWFGEEKGL